MAKEINRFSSILIALILLLLSQNAAFCAQPPDLPQSAREQIGALLAEKASWTPTQCKMESQLIHASKKTHGKSFAALATHLLTDVELLPDGRVLVDIKGNVTPELLTLIANGGGQVLNSFPQYQAIRALVLPEQMESLAASPDLITIRRAAKSMTRAGSVTTEGDITHAALAARNTYGATGAGIKVGVLSDGAEQLDASQATDNLGPVTLLSLSSGSEGTAMLEIIHDLAPQAQLFFAPATGSPDGFANNIRALRTAGCDIIVDDVGFMNESPFQDGPIALAVNDVTADGALFFSAADNAGNKDAGTSGTWEGDFVDGGPAGAPITTYSSGRLHNFGSATFVTCTGSNSAGVDLSWSDPLGVSTNDYDLFVLDATGSNLVHGSITRQNGIWDPYENCPKLKYGERIVIVKVSGAGRFLHLDTDWGKLDVNTTGSSRGHCAAASAFGVSAASATSAYPGPFTGGTNNPLETFTSDGPRRMFYNANGTAITPGNFSSTGGALLRKPDITAADRVSTSVSGFHTFAGTSAAAPHAAAIAALLMSYNRALTRAQICTALTNTVLTMGTPGWNRNSGLGMIMADRALASVPAPTPSAPAFATQPVGVSVAAGDRVDFYATATGSAPLSCQWRKNDVAISGATNWQYTVPSAQFSDIGNYSARVTNTLGSVVSSNAFLYVPDLPNALDAPELTWTNGGEGVWIGQGAVTHDGTDAAESPQIKSNQTWLQTTIIGPGTLSFWWKAHADIDTDFFRFYTNGTQSAEMIGNQDWLQRNYSIPAGSVTLRWTYFRATNSSIWLNQGWVDQVSYIPSHPTINTQPANQTIRQGASANFSVTASGISPLNYQWRRNGTNIIGATAALYGFTNAQTNDSASFSVVVSNIAGTVTSSNAVLSVLPPMTLKEALDATNLTWATGGVRNWVAQTNVTFYGEGAAQSGTISDNQDSTLSTTVTGPGTLAFRWKVSSEGNCDFLTFDTNGTAVAAIAGEVDWQLRSYEIAAGSQTLRWTYSKDSSFSHGSDAGWLDQVSFTPPSGPPVITDQPADLVVQQNNPAIFSVTATGLLPMSFQWRKSSVNIDGATNSSYSLPSAQFTNAGSYSVIVSNAAGWVISSNATLSVVPVALDHFYWSPIISPQEAYAPFSVAIGAMDISGTVLTNFAGPVTLIATTSVGEVVALYPTNIVIFTNGLWQGYLTLHQGATNLAINATDGFGHASASNPFNVIPLIAPIFTRPPVSQTVFVGSPCSFIANVTGTQPMSYQWCKENVLIAGATDQTFTITSSQTNDVGNYTVIVSNAGGTTTSTPPAVLTLRAVLIPTLTWSTGGTLPWFDEAYISHGGATPKQSGAIDSSQVSWIEATATGPGILTFWWKVSSEQDCDFLTFSLSGQETNRISGEVDWEQHIFAIPAGIQTFRWQYSKDPSTDIGYDAGWLDQVDFTPSLRILNLSVSNNVASLWVPTLYGSNYVLSYISSLNQTNWQSLPQVQGDGNPLMLVDPSPNSPFRYYRVQQQ